jgi:hypothetical protein
MFRFYCHLIPRFSEICLPLSDLTCKGKSNNVAFNDVEREAFLQLKQALIHAACVYAPDYNKSFIVACDASDRAVAGCLSQMDDSGIERPIAFVSAKLNPTQSRWSTIEKESYACLFALKSFDIYIFGSKVDLITDNNPLVYLARCSPRSPKLERWILGIQRWDINMQHRAGKLNVVPDCLSRY